MITVKIVRDDSRRVTGVFMSGHAGYAKEGSDIVCSAASTLVYTLANSIETICGVPAEDISRMTDDEEAPRAEVIIPYDRLPDEATRQRAAVVAETIHTGFVTLASGANEGGKKYIKLVEDN